MAEAPDGVTETLALQREIIGLREKAEALVGELAGRLRHGLDVRAQLRERAAPLLIGTGTAVALLAVWAGLRIHRAREERRLAGRLGHRLRGIGALLGDPRAQVTHHRPRTVGRIVFEAALAAVAATTAKLLTKRLLAARLAG